MECVNRVELLGEVITDIELKKTLSGKQYCDFALMINSHQDNADEIVSLIALENTAELIRTKVKKGQKILLTDAELSVGSYVVNNEKRFTTEVIVHQFELV